MKLSLPLLFLTVSKTATVISDTRTAGFFPGWDVVACAITSLDLEYAPLTVVPRSSLGRQPPVVQKDVLVSRSIVVDDLPVEEERVGLLTDDTVESKLGLREFVLETSISALRAALRLRLWSS